MPKLLRKPADHAPDLLAVFQEVNEASFDGFLDPPLLHWNSRLRSSAGRFIPGSRRWYQEHPPKIEVASYLLEEVNAADLVKDTLAHEMIHYWLWVRRRPYGHTDEFYAKMNAMGVSRYNPVPRLRPPKYLYKCPSCAKAFPARRKLGILACRTCCDEKAGGQYDARFRLIIVAGLISIPDPESQPR